MELLFENLSFYVAIILLRSRKVKSKFSRGFSFGVPRRIVKHFLNYSKVEKKIKRKKSKSEKKKWNELIWLQRYDILQENSKQELMPSKI